MPEEVQASQTGPNGERLELRMGTKALGLTTNNLLSILLLVAGVVGGYLLYVRNSDAQKLLYTQQQQMVEGLRAAQVKILEMLHEQELKMVEALRTQDSQLRAQTETIRQYLVRHDFNQGKPPEDRLPLEGTSPAPHQDTR